MKWSKRKRELLVAAGIPPQAEFWSVKLATAHLGLAEEARVEANSGTFYCSGFGLSDNRGRF